jgi:small-conductance mechanosensitive channel
MGETLSPFWGRLLAQSAAKNDAAAPGFTLGEVPGWLLDHGTRIALIVVMTLVAVKLTRLFINKVIFGAARIKDDEQKKRIKTLSSVVENFLTVVLLIVGTVMILSELQIPIGPILTAAGVVGIAVGFGAQNLVKDIITGFFIVMDDQIRIGDIVEIAGKSGLVEKMNLRLTILRDAAGNVHFVRNGEITIVTNMTKDYSRYVFDISVSHRENVDEVIEVIKMVDRQMRDDPVFSLDILDPIEILGLDRFSDSGIIIKARTMTKPSRQWAVGREFNKRLKKAFDERNIQIPFPHLMLYMGQDKKGQAAPLKVEMLNGPQER